MERRFFLKAVIGALAVPGELCRGLIPVAQEVRIKLECVPGWTKMFDAMRAAYAADYCAVNVEYGDEPDPLQGKARMLTFVMRRRHLCDPKQQRVVWGVCETSDAHFIVFKDPNQPEFSLAT